MCIQTSAIVVLLQDPFYPPIINLTTQTQICVLDRELMVEFITSYLDKINKIML